MRIAVRVALPYRAVVPTVDPTDDAGRLAGGRAHLRDGLATGVRRSRPRCRLGRLERAPPRRRRGSSPSSTAAVVGWLAVTPVSTRACYRGVVEHSVYVAADARGAASAARCSSTSSRPRPQHGIWTIQTSIIASNEASLALHDAVGFRTVGRRERIAAARRRLARHDAPRAAVAVRAGLARVQRPSGTTGDAGQAHVAGSASRASAGTRRRRCVRRSRTSSRRRSRPARAAPRSGCSRGRRSGRRPPG